MLGPVKNPPRYLPGSIGVNKNPWEASENDKRSVAGAGRVRLSTKPERAKRVVGSAAVGGQGYSVMVGDKWGRGGYVVIPFREGESLDNYAQLLDVDRLGVNVFGPVDLVGPGFVAFAGAEEVKKVFSKKVLLPPFVSFSSAPYAGTVVAVKIASFNLELSDRDNIFRAFYIAMESTVKNIASWLALDIMSCDEGREDEVVASLLLGSSVPVNETDVVRLALAAECRNDVRINPTQRAQVETRCSWFGLGRERIVSTRDEWPEVVLNFGLGYGLVPRD